METIFLVSIAVILYTYLGYACTLWLAGKILQWIRPEQPVPPGSFTPSLTLIVAAWNEAACIEDKIRNSLALQYPAGKIHFIFVTDGSTDETPQIVSRYPQVQLLHSPARAGKISAVHHALQQVQTEIVVFTDANTLLNADALLYMSRHFSDERTGAVAGEKKIRIAHEHDATTGEGFYWQYESKLKQWESRVYSVMGAAGELFCIRRALYRPLPPDTILDDLMISFSIMLQGYRVGYEPKACAVENSSAAIGEELKRKLRIAAGGIQALFRMPRLLLYAKQPLLSFEYISHRVFRWVVAPYLLLLAFILNIVLVNEQKTNPYWSLILIIQVLFYCLAVAGWLLKSKRLGAKQFFIPYYFCLMNYSMIAGMLRYVFSGQTVLWEKAKRKKGQPSP